MVCLDHLLLNVAFDRFVRYHAYTIIYTNINNEMLVHSLYHISNSNKRQYSGQKCLTDLTKQYRITYIPAFGTF
jgi:hypothetical protein